MEKKSKVLNYGTVPYVITFRIGFYPRLSEKPDPSPDELVWDLQH
jgi:hypothetical protein